MKSFPIVLSLLVAGLPGVASAQDVGTAAKPGDPVAGDNVFDRCGSCHQIGEGAENSIGPELNGVIGRRSATIPDYDYSPAMKSAGLVWDDATFLDYIRNPKAKVPGTKMNFPGLSSQKDALDLLAYLKQYGPDGKTK